MRKYSVTITEATMTTASNLLRIVCQTNRCIVVTGVRVTTDASAADSMNVVIGRGTGGGTAVPVTPEAKSPNDTAYSGTVYDLTGDTDGTVSDIIDEQRVDTRAGYYWKEPFADGIEVPGAGIFFVDIAEDITSTNVKCVVDFVELG